MMNTNFAEVAGVTSLKELLGIGYLGDMDEHQRKAQRNMRECARDAYGFVLDWCDGTDNAEDSRAMMLSPKRLFDYIYNASLDTLFFEGGQSFGKHAEEYLKDIRFCGKEFLQKVAYFYTAKTMTEDADELDPTEEDIEKANREFTELRAELGI